MSHRICAFTGHRRIKTGHAAGVKALLSRAVSYAYGIGVRTFLCGGAIGFDMLAAREVIRFRASHPDVRLVMVLPCIEQSEKWSAAQQNDYEYILRYADEAVYVSDTYTTDCMKRRNAELVARSDMLVAYVSHARSGSGQTLNLAKKAGIDTYNLYPSIERGEW